MCVHTATREFVLLLLLLQAEFHSWLTDLMESGNITRQEAVSMLPPLFLDVQPKHLVSSRQQAPSMWLLPARGVHGGGGG